MTAVRNGAVLALLLVLAAHAQADTPGEIDFLLKAVGRSECTFLRNGKEHNSRDAEDHLRMKYRRGKRYVRDTEGFIQRIATKSSLSGKLYKIRCGSSAAQSTADWLREKRLMYPDSPAQW